jgi:hypothetical protein
MQFNLAQGAVREANPRDAFALSPPAVSVIAAQSTQLAD